MKDKYGNKITIGATFKVMGGGTIHIGETGIIEQVCVKADPPYLVGNFEDKEPVMQVGRGKEPVVGIVVRFSMTLYAWEIEIQNPLKEVMGKWPGDESIEEILCVLKEGKHE